MTLILTSINALPLVQAGDDIGDLLISAIDHQVDIDVEDGDIIAVTSKIISKAEGRFANLRDVTASPRAVELARQHDKDPRLIELILQESRELIRVSDNTIIVEHKLGFICANAGIDHSNARSSENEEDFWYLLLPQDPERSARLLRQRLMDHYHKELGVLVIDSQGRAWRHGTVGMMIGTAGVPALVDLHGKEDLFGYPLRITQVAAADELAAAASLLMGQADEKVPAVHIRGFPYLLCDSSIREALRSKDEDLFR